MNKRHNKYTPEWEKEIKNLSLILNQTDDSKSKQLQALLQERSDLDQEKQSKSQQIQKLSTQRKQLLNTATYVLEVEKEATRLNTHGTTHNPRMNNFIGTGTGTKWKTNGWLTNATNHFTPNSGVLNNLYKIKINNSEIETTEEQIINTIAYIVTALKKIDAADFTSKHNAKESDTAKQSKVATYLTNLQNQEIIIGNKTDSSGNAKQPTYDFANTYQKYDKSTNTWTAYSAPAFNYAEFFEFIELVHNQSFLTDLDSDKQKQVPQASSWQISLKGETWKEEELADYGINIDPLQNHSL